MARSSLFRLVVQEFERRYLLIELRRNGWNRAQTARELGISYRGLLSKITLFQLSPSAPESGDPASVSA